MSVRNACVAAGLASLTASIFGYGIGHIGGIIVLPSLLHRFELDTLPEHDLAVAKGLIVSVWLVGAFFGVLFAIPVCARLGRKGGLIFTASLFLIGASLQLPSSNLLPGRSGLYLFGLGRLLGGIGVGAGTLVGPLYISETSPVTHRGTLLALYQVLLQVSALIGFWGAYISYTAFPDNSDLQWQIPIILQLVPGSVLFCGGFYSPESPVWLVEHDDNPLAIKSLAWLRGQRETSTEILSEVDKLHAAAMERAALDASREKSEPAFVTIFRRPAMRRRLGLGVIFMTFNALGGSNALNFYAPTVFQNSGFHSTSASLFLTGIFGLVKLASAIAYMLYFVRVRGHRFWLNVGAAVCGASLLVLAVCIRTFEHSDAARPAEAGGSNIAGLTACLMVYIFVFFWGIGLGSIAWNFCAEVFPSHLSTTCCAITTSTQWLFQVVNAVATPLLMTSTGWLTFIIFGVINLVSLVWCVLCVPETRGVPLGKEMDKVFEDKTVDESRIVDERRPLLS